MKRGYRTGGMTMAHGMKYRTGMYGGSFNPLHLGHVDCIVRAACLCRKLYVVISYRNSPSDVDVKVKYRWVHLLTKHIGNIEIILLEDLFESKDGYTREYWEDDSRKIRERINEKIDVVFCGGDYDGKSFWNVCYPESEFHVFERSMYNSTDIRADLYGHWEWMPQVVRAHYVKKVLIIGGESTGKSTLTINLANHYNTNYLEEVGRDLSEISGTDLMMLSEDFTRILLEHKAREMRLIGESNRVFFEDTDCLITRFYMDFLKDPNMKSNAMLAEAIAAVNSYDLILFLEPDVDWVQEGDRSEVIAADREKYSRKIKQLYDRYGFSYISVSGNYQERYSKAIEYVDALLSQVG